MLEDAKQIRQYILENEDNFFFAPFTKQRQVIRELWNIINNQITWLEFLYYCEYKVVRVADALSVNNETIFNLGMDKVFEMYKTLYESKK